MTIYCKSHKCEGVAAPYYSQGCGERSSYAAPNIVKEYDSALAVDVDFIVPLTPKVVVIKIPKFAFNLNLIGVANLLNVQLGELEILGYDPLLKDIKVTSSTFCGFIPPGTVVPKGTLFNLVTNWVLM